MNKQQVKERCERHGFTFDDYSPGDGVTRYRFMPTDGPTDYFATNGDYTALGWKEAQTYIAGRIDGVTVKV